MTGERRKRIRVAAILGGAARAWFTTLPQLLLLAALARAPLIALQLYAAGARNPDSLRAVTGRAQPLLDLLVSAATEAFVVGLVLARLRREPLAPLRSLRAGVRRLGTVLGITAIINAPNGVFAALDLVTRSASDPFTLLARSERDPFLFLRDVPWDRLGATLAVAVIALLVDVCLCAPIPIALVERRGVIASIGRSWILSHGNRLALGATYLFLALAGALALDLPLFLRSAFELPPDGAAALALDVAGDLLVSTFVCVVPIVAFHELRDAEADPDGEHFVEVFR